MPEMIEFLNFLDRCRERDEVAIAFFQPDGTYIFLPASAEFMADKDSDEAIGHMLISQYRDALDDLEKRKGTSRKGVKIG